MQRKVTLLERPIRREFSSEMKARVEEVLGQEAGKSPVSIKASWHNSDPLLRLATKFVTIDTRFGPGILSVDATFTTIGLFLDTKKSRSEALALVNTMADAIGA